jgi:hypothetical protein
MQLVRLYPSATNLAATAELYDLGEDLVEGRLSLEAAYQRLHQPLAPILYSNVLQVLAGSLVSGAFAVLFHSSWLGVLGRTGGCAGWPAATVAAASATGRQSGSTGCAGGQPVCFCL